MSTCPVCRKGAAAHTLEQARACLAAIERVESQRYCRLTGPKKATA